MLAVTVRVGVVGGGLVAQAEHLPYLSALRDRSRWPLSPSRARPSARRWGALRDPGPVRRQRDAGRRGGARRGRRRSPAGTHAEVILAALDAGLHVFVEKPMCITLADADAIVAARDRAGVVQVGTMKRFDPAYEGMLAELPDSAAELRYISVVVNDPESSRISAGRDRARQRRAPRADRGDPPTRPSRSRRPSAPATRTSSAPSPRASSAACSTISTWSTGCSRRWASRCPAEVVAGDWWNEGRAVYRIGASRERRALGQRLDPAARHARIPRVDLVLLRRLGAHARRSRRHG